MKKVFIVYTCDTWHSHDSKRTGGIFSSKLKAVNAIKEHAKIGSNEEDGEQEISEHDLYLLETINQTQGRSENYIIEEEFLNPEKLF